MSQMMLQMEKRLDVAEAKRVSEFAQEKTKIAPNGKPSSTELCALGFHHEEDDKDGARREELLTEREPNRETKKELDDLSAKHDE